MPGKLLIIPTGDEHIESFYTCEVLKKVKCRMILLEGLM